jgi:hypothetical protein
VFLQFNSRNDGGAKKIHIPCGSPNFVEGIMGRSRSFQDELNAARSAVSARSLLMAMERGIVARVGPIDELQRLALIGTCNDDLQGQLNAARAAASAHDFLMAVERGLIARSPVRTEETDKNLHLQSSASILAAQ